MTQHPSHARGVLLLPMACWLGCADAHQFLVYVETQEATCVSARRAAGGPTPPNFPLRMALRTTVASQPAHDAAATSATASEITEFPFTIRELSSRELPSFGIIASDSEPLDLEFAFGGNGGSVRSEEVTLEPRGRSDPDRYLVRLRFDAESAHGVEAQATQLEAPGRRAPTLKPPGGCQGCAAPDASVPANALCVCEEPVEFAVGSRQLSLPRPFYLAHLSAKELEKSRDQLGADGVPSQVATSGGFTRLQAAEFCRRLHGELPGEAMLRLAWLFGVEQVFREEEPAADEAAADQAAADEAAADEPAADWLFTREGTISVASIRNPFGFEDSSPSTEAREETNDVLCAWLPERADDVSTAVACNERAPAE